MKALRANNRLALDYHVESRNGSGLKSNARAHLHNYSPEVQQLVTDGCAFRVEGARVALPPPMAELRMTLQDSIENRCSSRDLAGPVQIGDLSTLLRLACGRPVRPDPGKGGLRGRGSANSGSLSSIQTFVLASKVTEIPPGLYHYDDQAHSLCEVRRGNFSSYLAAKVFYQGEFADAAAQVALTCSIGRLMEKYGSRGYRLGLLDAGHVSQTLYLVSVALGLNVCACAGFIDDEMDRAIGLDGITRATLLMVGIGMRSADRFTPHR